MRTYAPTNNQWAHPARPLVSSAKLNRVSSVQLSRRSVLAFTRLVKRHTLPLL